MTFWIDNPRSSMKLHQPTSFILKNLGVLFALAVANLFTVAFFMANAMVEHKLLSRMILAGIVTFILETPAAFIGWRLGRHHTLMLSAPTKQANEGGGLEYQWFQALSEIDQYEVELRNFITNLTPNDPSYEVAKNAHFAVQCELWDCVRQYQLMQPYLKTRSKGGTVEVIKAELANVKARKESIEQITDNVLNYSIRSASFTSADKTHLNVIANEIAFMCESLDELGAQAKALPASTSDNALRSQYKDKATSGF